jgi:hypothetical protein
VATQFGVCVAGVNVGEMKLLQTREIVVRVFPYVLRNWQIECILSNKNTNLMFNKWVQDVGSVRFVFNKTFPVFMWHR